MSLSVSFHLSLSNFALLPAAYLLGKLSLCNQVDHFLPVCFVVVICEHDYCTALCRFVCESNQRQVFRSFVLTFLNAKPAAVPTTERDPSSLPGFLISPSPLAGQQDGRAEMHLSSPTQGATPCVETRHYAHDTVIVSRLLPHISLCQTG